jgi:lysophospholipase L1-like esterase
MTIPFLLLADLMAKQPSEPTTPQIEPESTSTFWNVQDDEIDRQGNDRISSRDISPPEMSVLSSVWTENLNDWLKSSEPELPPLASADRYLPTLTPPAVTPPPATPEIPQTALRYSSFAISYVPPTPKMPKSGAQLYHQRLAALNAGQTYTRLSGSSFWSSWENASQQPTYEQWKSLLANEARAIAYGQGSNRLSILLGDSISLWFPPENLTHNRLWLNQGISGDTTTGILNRLSALAPTRPDTIYLMAGINDLRRGETDATILRNFQQIIRRLRQQHPNAQVVVQSILPTQLAEIPNSRIRYLNGQIQAIAQVEGAEYLDIYSKFINAQGTLRQELTTDGIHLSSLGYQVWRTELRESESSIALYHRP